MVPLSNQGAHVCQHQFVTGVARWKLHNSKCTLKVTRSITAENHRFALLCVIGKEQNKSDKDECENCSNYKVFGRIPADFLSCVI